MSRGTTARALVRSAVLAPIVAVVKATRGRWGALAAA